MYSKLVFLCLTAACVIAAPAPTDVVPLEKQQPTVIPIVSQSEELESNGTYKFSYETANGIKREETSYDKVVPKVEGRSATGSDEGGESEESGEIHVQQGSYSYTAPDGTVISVRYIADENGFRPVGNHIPQSIVAAAAAAGSSGEKSGRALSVADNANSASAPAATSAPAPAPAAAAKPEEKKDITKAPESPIKPKQTAAESVKPTGASGETTESGSEASPSTTEAASTANASNQASTGTSEGTTVVAKTATKATDATTEAASESPEEPSSTSADASTTEAVSTASA